MSKFRKRLQKNNIKMADNALVIETRFGHISDLVDIYDNIFLVAKHPIKEKYRNLVYRKDFTDIGVLPSISNIFVDPIHFVQLNEALPIITRFHPNIVVSSENLIERNFSKSVWQVGYRPIEIFDKFHVWKKVK